MRLKLTVGHFCNTNTITFLSHLMSTLSFWIINNNKKKMLSLASQPKSPTQWTWYLLRWTSRVNLSYQFNYLEHFLFSISYPIYCIIELAI
jgi:hypothetical protein